MSTLFIQHHNSICRIDTEKFEIVDSYILPDKVLLYTIACIENGEGGYVIAGVVSDTDHVESSGHEYWLFHANKLSEGPICKLGDRNLNNATLFHTLFIPKDVEQKLNRKEVKYHVPLREDYSKEELLKWDTPVLKGFEDLIWPYFDKVPAPSKIHETTLYDVESKLRDLSIKRMKEPFGKEYLIEERVVNEPAEFAELIFDEVNRMLTTTGWKIEYQKKGLLVESKPISGRLAASGVLVTRASAVVKASAQATFDMLVSPEGYAVIDPISNPEDHKTPPLELYKWKEGCRLEAAIATTKLPMMTACDFVVLNAIDPLSRTFVSKSILHDKVPGGSKYSDVVKPSLGNERALNTFAIKIEPIDSNSCRVYSINYADMAGKTSAKMNNFVNTKIFFRLLYKRIDKAMRSL